MSKSVTSRGNVPYRSFLGYLGLVIHRAMGSVGMRDFVLGAGALALVVMAAEEAAEGPLATPSPDPVLEEQDPVLVAVGSTPIRLSDARAQAVISPITIADELHTMDLFETGLVNEAADQVALAKLAEQQGLDEALEVRAQLALARRRILSSAILDLAVNRYVSEEQIRAAYDAEVAVAMADQTLLLRRIQVASRKEADEIAARIEKGISFSEMARRRSLDMSTRGDGGNLGRVRLSNLPENIGQIIKELPLGEVSTPVEGSEGWYLLMVDARSVLRMPPYEEVHDEIERRLREDVVSRTIAEARAAVPIRMAGTGFGPEPFAIMSQQAGSGEAW